MIPSHSPIQSSIPIISHQNVVASYYRLKFHSSQIARSAKAGQFIHVLPRQSSAFDPLLRRAFSIVSVENDEFEILYRVEGRGTMQMAQWKNGDMVDVIGPLGNGFAPLPEPPQKAILVGGGVGVPPLAMLASTRLPQHSALALIGARSAQEVICRDDFAKYEVPLQIATDDGSLGHHGFVTDLLKIELERGSKATVYACGPLPMLRATAKLCEKFQVPCQVSLEENMPCGVGVCNGCVIAVNGAGDEYGRYRRICVEGPVLWGHEIDWNRFEGGVA